MKKLRVGIILGGMSSEREVSLNSGRNVYDNLDAEFYE
jgi:D-alanine-D-alanine ligase